MEQTKTPQTINKNSTTKEINHKVINPHIKNIQIQSIDKKSNACSLNQNIENMNINGEMVQQRLKNDMEQGSLSKWKVVIGCVTLAQFSILFSLILIQYISSKIELSTLILILILAILIHTIFIIALSIIRPNSNPAISINNVNKVDMEKIETIQMPTVPKINQQIRKSNNAKTKKMQFPNVQMCQQQITEQIVRKGDDRTSKQIKEFKIDNISFTTRRNSIIISKIIQAILQVIIPSLILFLFDAHSSYPLQISIIVLSTTLYVLSIGSFTFIFIFLKKISIKKIQKQETKQVNQQEQQPKTKISIDQAIQPKINQKNNVIEQKIVKFPMEELKEVPKKDVSPMLKIQNDKQIEKMCKSLIKRSVLKNKLKKPSLHHIIEQQTMQRRRVQINSKKIQYFQYSEISASHSIAEDQDNNKNKLANKSKYHLQKLTNQHQKMEYQQKLLQSKIQQRQKKVKSQICLANNKKEVKEDEETRPDYFC